MTVKKLWGEERILVNDELYCVKELFLKHGAQSSKHVHLKKRETFLVVDGIVELEVGDQLLELNGALVSQFVTVEPGTPHRFRAISQTALIIETSTRHEDSDTYRSEPSRIVVGEIVSGTISASSIMAGIVSGSVTITPEMLRNSTPTGSGGTR